MRTKNALLALSILVLMSACDDPKVAPDFGPEVPAEEIQKALDASRAERNPLTEIKLGQYVHYSEVQVLNGAYEGLISDVGMTVIDRQETATQIDFKIIQNKIAYAGSDARKSSTEYNVSLEKPATQALDLLSTASEIMPIKSFTYKAKEDESPTATTYHNLRVSTEVVKAPAAVAKQTNCLGIPNCSIRVFNVGYDEVVWTSATKATRVTFDFALSPDVPFLAHEMNKCMTFLMPVDAEKPDSSQKVHIKYCMPVVDFRYQCSRAEDPNCPDPTTGTP